MARAELLSIGTELLLGQILNTNAQFLSAELAGLGIDCIFQTTVGDNTERIIDCLRQGLNRAQIVITTGGLGPTADDLTHECIAELFGVEMEFDQTTLDKISSIFQRRSLVMSETNRKQALRPFGSQILPNVFGTAPGIIWKLERELLERASIANPDLTRYIITFPGVPSEMRSMWQETAKPFLAQIFGGSILWSQDLKHFGISESALAEKYASLLDGANPTVAPLAGAGECRLRVSVKAENVDSAQKLAAPICQQIKKESGHLFYGIDNETLESAVGHLLTEQGKSVATAESCTGGLVSKRLTDIAGSSKYIALNVVTYSDQSKEQILKVKASTLAKHGAVSLECAREMALGLRELTGADIAVSLTGIAGPGGGSEDKPVGLVYIALAAADYLIVSKRAYHPKFGRDELRQRSANEALNMIRLYLLDPSILTKEYA
ncbi:MAG: competence/damage-inducible protein A [Candidatus Obscuribacterales bacterium]|nr:competence/damage-inducible protein A [Candidatus Obscuribacterales bacterium]